MSTRMSRKTGAGLVAAFVLGAALTACGSDSGDSSGKTDGSSGKSTDASPEDCRAKTAKGGSNNAGSKPRKSDTDDPITVKFGETVRAEIQNLNEVDITVSEPTVSTGKLRESTGPGTPCMVKVTVVGVEQHLGPDGEGPVEDDVDPVELDHTDFEARSDDREEFEYAYVDNNLEDETVRTKQELDTAVSYLVPQDKTIAEVSLNDIGDVAATWAY